MSFLCLQHQSHLTRCSIPIEHRPAIEATQARGVVVPRGAVIQQAVVQITPDGLLDDPESVYNPSFDVTPAKLISAVVTERGVHVVGEGFDIEKELARST